MSSDYPIRAIFKDHLPEYLGSHDVSREQASAAMAISRCKTGDLGVNVSICDDCGHRELHNCSCRNRSCPNCQSVMKELWIDQRRSEVLDAPYFHVVFTVPGTLNPLFLANQKLLYTLLHKAAAQTLLTLAKDKRYLGAEPGIIQVLHTWGQTLSYHPHVHCIVSGAGLSKDKKLVLSGKSFFVPVRAAMKMFRGKFICQLKAFHNSGNLIIPSSASELARPEAWQSFVDKLYTIDWCPYIKETFNGFGNAIKYLGRYTHRVAISNGRIISVTDDKVSFWYRDYRDNNTRKVMSLDHDEFMRRFLMHVLPKGFQKIRYFGYLANAVKGKRLRLLFELQGYRQFRPSVARDAKADIIFKELLGLDLHHCPCCGNFSMHFIGRSYRPRL